MNKGLPPTRRNARTGELTPPGISSSAAANNCCDLECMFVCRLYSTDCFFRFDRDRAKARQPHRTRRSAFGLREKLPFGVVHEDLGIFARLTELACKLRGF